MRTKHNTDCRGEYDHESRNGLFMDGGGGGGGGGTSTTVQEIPAELKPLASAYTSKAIGLSNQAYTPYAGQRYADLNPIQYAGVGAITDRALSGSPTIANAEANLNQVIGGESNPYLDDMVRRAQESVQSGMNTAAFNSGSYGNSGVAETSAKAMGDIATQMYGGAYDADQARRMQAIGMAPQFGNLAYQDASQLLNAGQILQDQDQNQLDFAYEQFQERQADPYKKLAAMGGVFGSNLGGTSTTTQQNQGGGGK